MSTAKGTSYVTQYHPENDELWCELEVVWQHTSEPAVMYYRDGSGYPGYESSEIIELKMISYCDEPVQNMSTPHWVNWEDVMEQLNPENLY
jgi:hypothetical protein